MIPTLSLQQWMTLLAAGLPALFAWIGSTLAGILRQDGLPAVVNSLISIVAVLLCAVLNVLLAGKLTSNLSADFTTIQASANVLLAGYLHVLTPYVATLQTNLLSLIRPKSAQLVRRASPVSTNVYTPPSTTDHAG